MPRFKTTFNGYAAKFSPFVENRLAVATAQNFGIIGNGRLHILEVRQCVLLLPSSTQQVSSTPQPNTLPPAATPHRTQLTPAGLVETAVFDTADGLYDCAWSEENENVVLAASGDGSVKVYDLAAPPMANPLRVFHEHKHEVCGATGQAAAAGAVLMLSMRLTHLFGRAVLCCVQCCCLSWNMQRRDLFLSSSWDDSIKLYSIHNPASMQTFLGHSYCVYHVAW